VLFRFQNETSTIIWFLWYSWNGRLFRHGGHSEILACHTKFSLWLTKSKSIFYYFWAHREAHNSCRKMSMKPRGTHSSFSPVLNRPSLLPFTLRFPPPCLLGSIRGRFSQRVTYQSPFPSCSRSSYLLTYRIWPVIPVDLSEKFVDQASEHTQLDFRGKRWGIPAGLIEGVKRQSGFVFSALQIFLHTSSDCDIILPRQVKLFFQTSCSYSPFNLILSSCFFLRRFCRMWNRSLVSEGEFTRLVDRSILGS